MNKKNLNWTEKYKPIRFTDLVFTEDVHIKCLDIFKKLDNKSIIVLTGPVGVGKSTLARIMCSLFQYNVIEKYSNSSTIENKKNILIIEDVEHNFKIPNYKGVPIVITSTHNLEKYFQNNVKASFIRIKKLDYDLTKSILDKIYKAESMDFKSYTKLIKNCDYDLRSIINNLQVKNLTMIKEFINPYEIFTRHLKWDDFDGKNVNFVNSAYINGATKESSDAFSLYDILGNKYFYLPLSRVNMIRNHNLEIVKNQEFIKNRQVKRNFKNSFYSSLLNIKTKSAKNILYLTEAIEKNCVDFKIEDITNIKRPKEITKETCTEFSFTYKKSVTKFCKRYLTLEEFLNL